MPENSVSVLLIDIGNSRLKWQLRTGHGESQSGAVDKDNAARFAWPVGPEQVLVASVRENAELQQLFSDLYGARLHWLSAPLPQYTEFRHCYPQPQRLGVDRWLAMLGARRLYSSGNLLVVDSGTALTVDLLSDDNAHQGGFIVPGLMMARAALFGGTDKVRQFDDEADQLSLAPGRNTVNCVAAGTLRQHVALVKSVMAEYPDHRLLVTGGDGDMLAALLGSASYPDLIFDGMDSLCAGLFTA